MALHVTAPQDGAGTGSEMNQTRLNRLGCSLAALVIAAPLGAMAQVPELEEIVVSANLEPTAASSTGATVDVITEEQLQATGEIRVIDFLNRLPGVSVRTNGGTGRTATVSVRGANQNYVAVLVDGINVADPSGTQVGFDFGQLTTAGISRIEVLKGSQSALYGSSAVGGVINITTRRAVEEGTHQYLDAEIGSYGTGTLAYSLTHLDDRSEAAMTLSHVQTDGFSTADENDGNTEADPYEANRLSFNYAYALDNGAIVGASGFLEHSDGEFDESAFDYATGQAIQIDGTPGDEIEHRNTQGLRLFTDFTTGAVDNTLAASYFAVQRQYLQNDMFGMSDATYDGDRKSLSYQGGLDIGTDMRAVFGADYTLDSFAQAGTFGDLDADTTTTGVFGELDWSPVETLDITATLRHDDNSSFGGKTTGRIALAWNAAEDVIVRASGGTGYRAPSMYELYSIYGSPDLQPEDSRSADIGIEKDFGDKGFVRATAFWLEVDNLIDFNLDGTTCQSFTDFGYPGCYTQIPGISRRAGLELEGQAVLSEVFTLGLAYTYMDSDTNASSSWANLPKNDVALEAIAQFSPDWQGVLTVQSAMDRADLPDYTVVNATVTYDFGNDMEAYFRVENLFDEQYQMVDGYGTADRSVFLGIRASF